MNRSIKMIKGSRRNNQKRDKKPTSTFKIEIVKGRHRKCTFISADPDPEYRRDKHGEFVKITHTFDDLLERFLENEYDSITIYECHINQAGGDIHQIVKTDKEGELVYEDCPKFVIDSLNRLTDPKKMQQAAENRNKTDEDDITFEAVQAYS